MLSPTMFEQACLSGLNMLSAQFRLAGGSSGIGNTCAGDCGITRRRWRPAYLWLGKLQQPRPGLVLVRLVLCWLG